MDRDILLQASEIISHASCPDGIGAAMICAAAYSMTDRKCPPISFLQYGTKEYRSMPASRRQVFVDLVPPAERWKEWIGKDAIILDHHEMMKETVESLNGVYGGPKESGTTLAFDHVMIPLCEGKMLAERLEAWRRFAHLNMIRDTWDFESPKWDDACAMAYAVLLRGQKWCLEAALSKTFVVDSLLPLGRCLYDSFLRHAWKIAKAVSLYDVSLFGKEVKMAFFNHSGDGKVSDVAHYLIERLPCDIAVGYFYTQENSEIRCIVSLRTEGQFGEQLPMSKIAESFGGGGHKGAAAFMITESCDPEKLARLVTSRMLSLEQNS